MNVEWATEKNLIVGRRVGGKTRRSRMSNVVRYTRCIEIPSLYVVCSSYNSDDAKY